MSTGPNNKMHKKALKQKAVACYYRYAHNPNAFPCEMNVFVFDAGRNTSRANSRTFCPEMVLVDTRGLGIPNLQ